MGAFYHTIGLRVVAADPYMIEMIHFERYSIALRKAGPLSVTILWRDPHQQRIFS
jgi:hypothetical protein